MNTKSSDYRLPELPQIPRRTVTVTDYGAVGDGFTLCTSAIQAAIDETHASGGGKVVIPAGLWRTGPLTLRSHINLHIKSGAIVQFDSNPELYRIIPSHFEGWAEWRCQSPIDGVNLTDVAITGDGIWDGAGEGWRPVKRVKATQPQWEELIQSGGVLDEDGEIWWPSAEARDGEVHCRHLRELILAQGSQSVSREDYLPAKMFLRPNMVSLRSCKRVLLEGATFQNSPAWCLHPIGCEEVTIRNVQVRNPWYSQNGDGLDLESCSHALVEHNVFDVGDDAICLKSGKDEEGRRLGMPCQFITIRHCTVYHGHGGVVIGSEMSGGVKHVRVSDCVFSGTDIGLRFKSTRGRGGVVEDIVMERILMRDIIYEAVSFHLFYAGVEGSEGHDDTKYPVTEETPIFRDITLKDLVCGGAETALLVNGLPEMPLSNLHVENFRAASRKGIVLRYGDGITFNQVELQTHQQPQLTAHNCCNVTWNGDPILSASGTEAESIQSLS
ncbi:glycoside hydrolase family 28 protein [Saccharibacillus sp. JS10]|uniref:glycoside hydrolase family 28 protein n=1 Tax=Saccharibacillus sp. JS10 TaxID=2950552 RepID=UPI00210B88CA|nr:glycoside hydrolase family 28 protein [Saccharibacillus sp. JS10]MCQ4085471.1 glycoside hydrolase family 28 protein [Saccharibacillus sp. JS10]